MVSQSPPQVKWWNVTMQTLQIEYLVDGEMMYIRYLINRKSGISIAVAIPLYPSHRTSRKEVEGGLLCPLTREQFEMQEVAELAVVTLLVRYKTVYKSAYSSPS